MPATPSPGASTTAAGTGNGVPAAAATMACAIGWPGGHPAPAARRDHLVGRRRSAQSAVQTDDPGAALGQGAGLVQDQRADAGQRLQRLCALISARRNAPPATAPRPGPPARPGIGGQVRCRDQDRHRPDRIARDPPRGGRQGHRDRQEQHRVPVGQTRHRRLGRLRGLHKADDAGIGAVGGATGGAEVERIAQIGRPAHHLLALRPAQGHGFAGQRRLVQQRARTRHRPVHRGDRALPDQQQVAGPDPVQRDLDQAIAPMQGGRAGDAGQQVGHLAPGAACGKTLKERAARIHQRDHRGRQRLSEDQCGGHGQRSHDVQSDLSARQAVQDLASRAARTGSPPR